MSVRRNDAAGAEAALQSALAHDADQPAVQHLLGCIALLRADPGKAELHLRRAVDAAPQRADYLSDLGLTLGQLGRNADAFGCFERAHQLEPGVARYAFGAAGALQALGRPAAALQWTERAAALGGGAAEIATLGGIYRDLRRATEAVACMNRAVRLTPASVGLRLYRAPVRLPVCYDDDAQRL